MNHYYIYIMYDKKDKPLYVGKTKNLKNRFQGHFTKATLKIDTWKKNVSYINTFECKSEYDMTILEIYLIGTLKPKYNKEFVFDNYPTFTIKYDKINERKYFINEKFIPEIKGSPNNILSNKEIKQKIRNNLTIYDGKMNINYFNKSNKRNNELSYLWFNEHATDEQLKQVCCNLENYFRNKVMVKSEEVLVIIYDEFILDKLKQYNLKGCIKGIRFFNQCFDESFNNRNNIAYLINDFTYGYDDIKNISYLISLLDYIINNSKEKKINLYLPSKRMRSLLDKWLKEE